MVLKGTGNISFNSQLRMNLIFISFPDLRIVKKTETDLRIEGGLRPFHGQSQYINIVIIKIFINFRFKSTR